MPSIILCAVFYLALTLTVTKIYLITERGDPMQNARLLGASAWETIVTVVFGWPLLGLMAWFPFQPTGRGKRRLLLILSWLCFGIPAVILLTDTTVWESIVTLVWSTGLLLVIDCIITAVWGGITYDRFCQENGSPCDW